MPTMYSIKGAGDFSCVAGFLLSKLMFHCRNDWILISLRCRPLWLVFFKMTSPVQQTLHWLTMLGEELRCACACACACMCMYVCVCVCVCACVCVGGVGGSENERYMSCIYICRHLIPLLMIYLSSAAGLPFLHSGSEGAVQWIL